MEVILIDTSVWINFFSGRQTKAMQFLIENLSKIYIATCPVIVQEVLQGVYEDAIFQKLNNHFNNFIQLPCEDEYLLAIQSASLYRQLRKNGVSIRKSNDCLIACYALNNDIPILHEDRDFKFIEEFTGLKTIKI